MPDALAGRGVDAHQALGEQIRRPGDGRRTSRSWACRTADRRSPAPRRRSSASRRWCCRCISTNRSPRCRCRIRLPAGRNGKSRRLCRCARRRPARRRGETPCFAARRRSTSRRSRRRGKRPAARSSCKVAGADRQRNRLGQVDLAPVAELGHGLAGLGVDGPQTSVVRGDVESARACRRSNRPRRDARSPGSRDGRPCSFRDRRPISLCPSGRRSPRLGTASWSRRACRRPSAACPRRRTSPGCGSSFASRHRANPTSRRSSSLPTLSRLI